MDKFLCSITSCTFLSHTSIIISIYQFQTSEYPFSCALIGYSSSEYPLDIHWSAKHNYLPVGQMKLIFCHCFNNFIILPQCQCIVMDIYLASSRLSTYPPLFTTTVNQPRCLKIWSQGYVATK